MNAQLRSEPGSPPGSPREIPARGAAARGPRGRTRLQRLLGRLLRVAGAVVALSLLMADDGIGRDELLCELAADRLDACCPESPARLIACVHGGCDSQIVPDLSEARAECLRSKSCAELIASGACDPARWEANASCPSPCNPTVPPCM